MSQVIPSANALLMQWAASHAVRFTTNQAAIGLSVPQLTSYTDANDSMQAAYAEYQDYKLQTEAKRQKFMDLRRDFHAVAMGDVRTIRAFAIASSDPANVYALADVPPVKTPADGVPPAQPINIRATLNTTNGNLRLTWGLGTSAALASGNIYIIQRRAGTSGAWTQAGLASARAFTDVTVPSAPIVQYQITAQRSGINGLTSQPVNVAFGHGANGEVFVASVKMAA
ncbi:MAG: hypothetical protein Q8L55_14840 [Phycisphaerales bacterium]|nr:hypothetical protein [Phycisphaerales bacterium]